MMDSTVVQYIGFGVVILILIWATVEMSRRHSRRKRVGIDALDTWVKMDSSRAVPTEEPSTDTDTGEREETSEESVHTRAQQNGHYSESKKPL
jgi:hypothetical protein